MKNKKIARLAVFITPSKKPVDASNIRKEMKNLTEYVKISKKKIFLYNFRYFFHVCFILYSTTKDIVRFADNLELSSV